MKNSLALLCGILVLPLSCAAQQPASPFTTKVYLNGTFVRNDTLNFFDATNKRAIPVRIYRKPQQNIHDPVKGIPVIISVGYGNSRNDYSYIANYLAGKDYVVMVIQHDLPGDAPLPTTGDAYGVHKPFWDRGVRNIHFALDQLRQRFPDLDYRHLVLIGHSMGGDMAMLIARNEPDFAKTVVTLDNRWVPVPLQKKPKILSIRSDEHPDENHIVPSPADQKKYHIKIASVHTPHNDMSGQAPDAQKKEINNLILNFSDHN